MLTILSSSFGPARGMTAERVAAHHLAETGFDVTLIGGRNRGHDLVATRPETDADAFLVDCKALTPTSPSERKNADCGRFKVYCRSHGGWSSSGRTHLALVALPEIETSVDYDGTNLTITVPVAGAEVYLVPLEDINATMEPRPGWDWLWFSDEWLANYRI